MLTCKEIADMKYILGIDQGSSKTHVIIGDETGHILGLGTGCGACHQVHGLEYAMNAVKEAAEAGLVNLAGHRLVGGMRASIYNAMPIDGVKALIAFIEKFEKSL